METPMNQRKTSENKRPLSSFEVFFLNICAAAFIWFWIERYGQNKYFRLRPWMAVIYILFKFILISAIMFAIFTAIKHIP